MENIENSEDHREKNILLAKSLNMVKMELRNKKSALASTLLELSNERQRNSKLESDQLMIINRINSVKKQVDDTFIKNTVGYMNLSKELVQLHQDSIQNSLLSLDTVENLTASSTQSVFLTEVKRLSETIGSNSSFTEVKPSDFINDSTIQDSLSFKTFQIGLNSTFVKTDESDSELNSTFTTDSTQNQQVDETMENQNHSQKTDAPLEEITSNITIRKNRTKQQIKTPKFTNKVNKRRKTKENSLIKMALRSATKIKK